MKWLLLLCSMLLAFSSASAALDILDVPVSSVTNKAYLSDMESRPWWNDGWRKRAAFLVSNVSDVRSHRATVDFSLDVGETIRPDDLRVVTPWGTVVPSVAIPGEGTAVEVVFQTELRERENRPFFVYWANPAAKAERPFSPLSMEVTEEEVRVNNGRLEVVFDNLHRTPGLIRSLRVNASDSPTELLWRTTGFAWSGFEFTAGRPPQGWSKARVLVDTPLKKTIRFEGKGADLDFTLHAFQPRVDYAYRLKTGTHDARISISWACGGGVAYDDFHYIGTAGRMLRFPAALDHVTDCIPQPCYYSFPWITSDWYAIRDRVSGSLVGQVFDRESLHAFCYLGLGAAHGENCVSRFFHLPQRDGVARGSGALVATIGGLEDFDREYRLLKKPPRVFVSSVQPWREIEVKVPRLDHDFCVNCNVGGWLSAKPLPGSEWAENIIRHLQELGANTILLGQLSDYPWTELPITKELYDEIASYAKPIYERQRRPFPEWDPKAFTGERLRTICETAHRHGLAVTTWHQGLPGIANGEVFDEADQRRSRVLQALYPKCGVDSVFNALAVGEGTPLPKELLAEKGRQFWKWDDPQPFFDSRKTVADSMRRFYEDSHRANPGVPVMTLNSENTELGREMCMAYQTGTLDTLFCEFVANMNFSKIKHTAKRLRAFFDNEDGRTIHHHYYFMEKDYMNRIAQLELPFICGVNGFSQEAMTYEHFDRDFFQITADFNHMALHTRLGEKAARMGPVKNLAVFRDVNCFEEDARKKRTFPREWYEVSRHDARGNAFAEIYNCNYDVVINAFFKRDSLARYKVVYIPDDEVFSDELAAELIAFVEGGGGAVLEGATATSCETLRKLALVDGQVKTIGKGKVLRVDEILTDAVMRHDGKAIERTLAALASVGGKPTHTIEKSRSLDSILQGSRDGFLLGVHNRGAKADSGVVRLDPGLLAADTERFVLDVKTGLRSPFDGSFEIEVGPGQCGFYLIGDDGFTTVPETREATWLGPVVSSTFPDGQPPPANPDPAFRPFRAVEFVSLGDAAKGATPAHIRRSEEAMVERSRFCMDASRLEKHLGTDDLDRWRMAHPDTRPYDRNAFAKALRDASYVHFQAPPAECDEVFADCKKELRALLARGGGILFDRNGTGPKAREFLLEAGVFDPYPFARTDVGDHAVSWDATFPTNHPFATACHQNVRGEGGSYVRAFGKWDRDHQAAPYRLARDSSYATLILQDKVLGAGKVAFNENSRSFNDWYEATRYGDNLLSWLMGLSVETHAEKTRSFLGGVGEPVE